MTRGIAIESILPIGHGNEAVCHEVKMGKVSEWLEDTRIVFFERPPVFFERPPVFFVGTALSSPEGI